MKQWSPSDDWWGLGMTLENNSSSQQQPLLVDSSCTTWWGFAPTHKASSLGACKTLLISYMHYWNPQWSPSVPSIQPQILPHCSACPLTHLLQLTSTSWLWCSSIGKWRELFLPTSKPWPNPYFSVTTVLLCWIISCLVSLWETCGHSCQSRLFSELHTETKSLPNFM